MLFFRSGGQRSKGGLDVMLQQEQQSAEFLCIPSSAAGHPSHAPANASKVILNGQGVDPACAQVVLDRLEVIYVGLLKERLSPLRLGALPHEQRIVEAFLESRKVADRGRSIRSDRWCAFVAGKEGEQQPEHGSGPDL